MARNRLGILMAGALLGPVASAGAASPDRSADAFAPRYAIDAPRLQATPSHDSIDGRYRLDARLRRSGATQNGSGIMLNAKLVGSNTAACTATGAIFTDGFD